MGLWAEMGVMEEDHPERGVLMLSLRPRPTPTCCTVATTAMVLDMVMATATLMEDTPTTDKV